MSYDRWKTSEPEPFWEPKLCPGGEECVGACADFCERRGPERFPKLYSVAVFEVTREYGGPEEGGWYYDAGEPSADFEQFTRTFKFEGKALDYRTRLERVLCRRLNRGRRCYTSVLGGLEYRAVMEAGLPAPFPATRPHYE
jgi:hypothetical protein